MRNSRKITCGRKVKYGSTSYAILSIVTLIIKSLVKQSMFNNFN